MKIIKIYLLFIIFISHCLWAQEIESLVKELSPGLNFSNAEMRILKQELKIQNLLIEGILELQQEGVEFAATQKNLSSIQELVNNAVHARGLDLKEQIKVNVSNIIETTLHPSKIDGQISKLKNFVLKDLINKKQNLVAITRRYGMQIGLYYLIAMQVDYTIPLVLIGTGTNVPLGTAMFSLPFSSTTTALFANFKASLKHYYLYKKLGLTDFRKYREISKNVKTFINRNFLISDYLVDLNMSGQHYLLTVRESNLITKLKNKMGYTDDLNYENLVKFMQENALYTERLHLLEQSDLTKQAKVLSLLHDIEQSGDTEVLMKISERFNKNIKSISSMPDLTHHMKWFLELSHSQNIDDLFRLIQEMPYDLPPKVFAKAWREYSLPQLSKAFNEGNFMNGYKAFRKLHQNYDKNLAYLFIQNIDSQFSANTKALLVDYLYESLADVGACGQVFKMKKGARAPLL